MPGANRAALSDGDLTVAAGNCEKPSAALAPFLYVPTTHKIVARPAGPTSVPARRSRSTSLGEQPPVTESEGAVMSIVTGWDAK